MSDLDIVLVSVIIITVFFFLLGYGMLADIEEGGGQ